MKAAIDRIRSVNYDIRTFPKESSFGSLSAAVFGPQAESGRFGRDFNFFICGVFRILEWKGV